MEVTLTLIDWPTATHFSTPAEFIDWFIEAGEDELDRVSVSAYDIGWEWDSAGSYFDVAELLEHLLNCVDEPVRENLKQGFGRVISADDSHVDDLGFKALEGSFWLSASPETVQNILSHSRAIDLEALRTALQQHPMPEGGGDDEEDGEGSGAGESEL